MTSHRVIPSGHGATELWRTEGQTAHLIRQAQESDEADRKLTIRQAIRKYKKAVVWAMFLSTRLIMEGYDLTQFKERFGVYDLASDQKLIPAAWQSGISNSALVGQLAGLIANVVCRDRFGCRPTMMLFMVWMTVAIFVPVFAPSLSVLAFGEALCGISWGVFQVKYVQYHERLLPNFAYRCLLRPYVTAYVCMCWGAGILLSSGVVRAVAGLEGELGWRLPFILQWIWPLPLFIGAYFAPESPWHSVRRDKMEEARTSLMRLYQNMPEREPRVEQTLAYIKYSTEMERAETANASFLECFKGTNMRRTEINCVAAGFSELQAFNINISLSACYIVGGIICWFLFPHVGRATIYMSGLTFMFFCLRAIGILLVMSTLCNMIAIGPTCYPIVAETPAGRLRYKTISIGRFVYNLTSIFTNSVTPRMLSSTSKAAFFYAGTNLLCNIWCWFRLPETKDRTFGEIDLLFTNRVPARKFKSTHVDQFAHGGNYVSKQEVEHKENVG
ncbi:major facilitator superfamily domain-containing protein [Aspergillus desertorum]